MTKRSLGLALLLGLPVVAGGAFAVHSLSSKPAPSASAEQRPDPAADAGPSPERHARGKKKKHHHARAQRADKAAGAAQAMDGAFQRWLVSPHGEALGMMLADGTIVKLPHGAAADPSLKTGDALHVEGKAHRIGESSVMMHATVSKAGQVLFAAKKEDKGKRAERDGQKLQPMTASGKVLALLPGRKDALLGVVLDDGTTVLFGHRGAVGDLGLKVGDAITVEGRGGTYPIGTGIAAQSIKLPNGEIKQFGRNKGA